MAFSLLFFNIKKANEALDTFIDCESLGVILGTECDKSAFGEAYYPVMSIFDIGHIIVLLYPSINLIYVIEVQEVKRRLKDLHFSPIKSKSTSGTEVP